MTRVGPKSNDKYPDMRQKKNRCRRGGMSGSRTLRPCGGFSQAFGYGCVDQDMKTLNPSCGQEISTEPRSDVVAEDKNP